MDLKAYAQIVDFEKIAEANGIEVPRLRGYRLTNNLRVVRERCGLSQTEVCHRVNDIGFDKFLLSKMENGICLPTDYQLHRLAQIYGVRAHEPIDSSIRLAEV